MSIHKGFETCLQSRAGKDGRILNRTFDVSDTNLS